MIKTLTEIPVEKLHLMTEKQKGIIENLLRENFYPSDISIDHLKIVLVYNYTTSAYGGWLEFVISVNGVIEFRFGDTNWGVLPKWRTIEDLIYSMMRDEYDFNFVSEWV